MADDPLGAHKLHPDDRHEIVGELMAALRPLFEATARGPAPTPPWPPVDGPEDQQFGRLKTDILRDVESVIRKANSEFLPEDEIDQRIKSVGAGIDRRLDEFKTAFLDDVRRIVQEEISKLRVEFFEIADDLGVPLEKGEKRRATREFVSDLKVMHTGSKEWKTEAWKAFKTWSIGGLLAAIGAGFTYLTTRGGPSH